jgi:hypothetical protein
MRKDPGQEIKRKGKRKMTGRQRRNLNSTGTTGNREVKVKHKNRFRAGPRIERVLITQDTRVCHARNKTKNHLPSYRQRDEN